MELNELLAQTALVASTDPPIVDIVQASRQRMGSGKCLKVLYGETYDLFGPTLDSLKYYFLVAAVGQAIQVAGGQALPTILVADIASCRNEPEEKHDELMAIGQKRVALVNAVSQCYGLNLKAILMSEYLHSKSFQDRLESIRAEAERRSDIHEWVRQTVPASKVEIEERKDFAYAFEEIATIIEYDIKVGPPREKFYDEPTRLIGKALGYEILLSVYLHPTYPLGLGVDFFFSNEEIEQYGVTPYKAGSKGLADNRIVFGATSRDKIRQLINKSFVSKKRGLPNPVLDLAIICEMACQRLQGSLEPINLHELFYTGQLAANELKQRTYENVCKYILDPIDPILQGVKN